MAGDRLPADVLADLGLPSVGDNVLANPAFADALAKISANEVGLYVARMFMAGAYGAPNPEALLALFLAKLFDEMPEAERAALLERVGLTKGGSLPYMVNPKEDRDAVGVRFAVLAKMMGVNVEHEEELPTVPEFDLRKRRNATK